MKLKERGERLLFKVRYKKEVLTVYEVNGSMFLVYYKNKWMYIKRKETVPVE